MAILNVRNSTNTAWYSFWSIDVMTVNALADVNTSGSPTVGTVLRYTSGSGWTDSPDSHEFVFPWAGECTTGSNPLRLYNRLGRDLTITEVFLSTGIGQGPTGADLIVDVKVNGTAVTSSPNRAKVTDGQETGQTTTFSAASFPNGSYLTIHYDQVGSTLPGSNLMVHVVAR